MADTPIGEASPVTYILNLYMIDVANGSLVRSVGVEIRPNLTEPRNLTEARKKIQYVMPLFVV